MRRFIFLLSVIVFSIVTLNTLAQDTAPTPTSALVPLVPQVMVIPPELPVQPFHLAYPEGFDGDEFSGLAWYGDTLVLLPQFPHDSLYTIDKEVILENLGTRQPTRVEALPFQLNGELNIAGFEGYEAIAFHENTVYLTIESRSNGMHSHLVAGTISETGIEIDVDTLVEIPQPVNVSNKADESIIMVGNQPMTLLEWNGDSNPNPVAHLYSPENDTFTEIPFPPLPYRVTDATTMDEQGRFWVINYLSPVDGSRQDTGLLEELNFRGTHRLYAHIERLLELQLVDDRIVLLDDIPLYLQLADEARNWEGLVRLDNLGFLLITDSYPRTILAFVPFSR